MAIAKGPRRAAQPDREQFAQLVGANHTRTIEGRVARRRSPWFWAGMFGLVGWSVAVPTALGVWLGMKLDEWFPSPASWTLMCIVVGLTLGCLNAWFWVRRESARND